MPRTDIILWIDLETTGSSNEARIVEFGAVLTDSSKDLNILGEFTATLNENAVSASSIAATWEAPIVAEMHAKSGLDKDLENPDYTEVSKLEQAILRWINDTVGFSTDHIPWGGSGVGHFDSKYIRRDMPYLSKRITYWVYDVGVLRRTLRLAGIENPSDNTEVKTHRALDDAKLHASEMRDYLKLLSNWKETVEVI